MHAPQQFATFTPTSRQPAVLFTHFPEEYRETASRYPTPPRTILSACALAALLATPAAWAACLGGDDISLSNVCYGSGAPSTVTVTSDYNTAFGGISDNSTGVPAGADTSGKAIGNSLTIESGTVLGAFGGIANVTNTLAEGNTLTVKGGTVNIEAVGGRSHDGPAIGNFVFIEGGTVKGVVLGGSATANGVATGNTVTLISGTVNGDVMGGHTSDCTAYDCFSNILAVKGKDFQVGAYVSSFTSLEFTLPANIAKGDTMLKVGDSAMFPASGTTTPTQVKIAMADGAKLKVGESVTLIEAGTIGVGNLDIVLASNTAKSPDGYEFELTTEGTPTTKLVATVTKEAPPPAPTPDPTPAPSGGDSSSPTMGELGLLLSGLALAGAAAPALRRRERKARKQD